MNQSKQVEVKEVKSIPIDKRNKEMIALRSSGSTLAEIGERYGVTKARVLQIVGKRTSYRRHITAQSIQREIAEFFAQHGTFPSLRAIADMVDVSTSYTRMLLDELAEQNKLQLTAQRGRIYIKSITPPADLPDEMREQAVKQLDEIKKEWKK